MGHSGYTHTDSRCSSVHLERGEINHTLQKDESPAAVAPSKQEREEGLEGEMGRKATAEFKDKRGRGGGGDGSDKKVFKKVSTADSWICAEITNCRGKASTCSSRACRRP